MMVFINFNYAFYNCYNLNSVSFPSNPNIPATVFNQGDYESLSMDNNTVVAWTKGIFINNTNQADFWERLPNRTHPYRNIRRQY